VIVQVRPCLAFPIDALVLLVLNWYVKMVTEQQLVRSRSAGVAGMNSSRQQADPRRHLAGISFVVLLHVIVVYALVSGLARKVVDVVRAPIETKVIEEVKKPPPPLDPVIPPPPRLEAPPPPFVPPPEVQIQTPAPPPAITATQTPPPAPVTLAPLTPQAPPVARPASNSAAAHCSKMPPPEAPALDFVGKISLTVRATIRGNRIVQADVVPGSFAGVSDRKVQRLIANAVTSAVSDYTCTGDNIVVEQQFQFTY
jgi:protein TonB